MEFLVFIGRLGGYLGNAQASQSVFMFIGIFILMVVLGIVVACIVGYRNHTRRNRTVDAYWDQRDKLRYREFIDAAKLLACNTRHSLDKRYSQVVMLHQHYRGVYPSNIYIERFNVDRFFNKYRG